MMEKESVHMVCHRLQISWMYDSNIDDIVGLGRPFIRQQALRGRFGIDFLSAAAAAPPPPLAASSSLWSHRLGSRSSSAVTR